MRRALRSLPLLIAAACGGAEEPTRATLEPFELQPVVANRIASLAAGAAEEPALPPLEEGDVAEIDGLIELLTGGDPQFRSLALDAVKEEIGPRATPPLAAALGATERPWEQRVAACELLATLDQPAATRALLDQLENAPEPWLRRWCAYHLASTSADWIVPRLLLRLKYEQDHETFVWLAATLGRFRNYAGLDALVDLALRGASDDVRAQAQGQLDALAGEAGLSPEELRRRWGSIDATSLPQPRPSDRLRLEAWQLVAAMNDETIQLRGVDDARYVLSRLGPWAAVELAAALADEDFHVRLHTAQVLERMGPRAQAAGPALLRALAEPLLAPQAAEALGRIGHPPARLALEERTATGHRHELRVACVRALGRLGLVDSLPVVQARYDEPGVPVDLRMAAATALVLLGQGDVAAAWLVAQLGASGGDPPAAELALETWLVRGVERGRPGFDAALRAWRDHAGAPGITPRLEEIEARRAARAQALEGDLTELLKS